MIGRTTLLAGRGMTISPADAALVRTSFDHVWPVAGHAADRFYERLFEIAPHLRLLFRGDMTEQKGKFMATLAVLVASLDDMSNLLPRAGTLARQHVLYGVEELHYALVGQALLWTLERELGPDWYIGDGIGVEENLRQCPPHT